MWPLRHSRNPAACKSILAWFISPFRKAPLQSQVMRFYTTPDIEEIVEDSEPERIQIRNQHRAATGCSSYTGNPWNTDLLPRAENFTNDRLQIEATTEIEIVDSDSPCGGDVIGLADTRPISIPKTTNHWQVEKSKPNKIIDLNMFAFTSKRKPRSIETPNSYCIPSSSNTARVVRPVSKKTRSAIALSLSEFSRVSRCICCDASWTTRKTAAQKMDHIRRCAQKHGYDNETIRILIKKENSSSLTLEKPNDGILQATTLLEDVIQETAPKKKDLHCSAGILVPSSSASRKTILARARDIITTPSSDEMSLANFTDRTPPHDHRTLMFADRQERPLTPLFMASKLAQKAATSLFSAPSQEDISPPISPTPHYLPSPKRLNISRKDVHLEQSPRPIMSVDNEHTESTEKRSATRLSTIPKKTLRKRISKLRKIEQTSSDDGVSDHEIVPMSRSRTPKARASAKTKVEFREEWYSFMKNRIRQDKDLSLRILRYEPIGLNVFLKFARLYSPRISDRKLTLHLRDFLDKEAIHFYEANQRR